MKVTNLETSQKLKELGFLKEVEIPGHRSSFQMCWYIDEEIGNRPVLTITEHQDKIEGIGYWEGKSCRAYDLETILDALPKSIKCKDKDYYFWTTYSGSSDCWIMGYVWGIERNMNFETYNEGDESLANTAGRLLIKLLEDKIIKLG